MTPRNMIKGLMTCWKLNEHLTKSRKKRILEDIRTATGDVFLHVFLPKQGLSESTIETLRVNGVYSYSELKEIKVEALRLTGIDRREIDIIRKL